MKLVLAVAAVSLLPACSHIRPIGRIGDTMFYKVQGTSLLGPTQVAIYSLQTGSNTPVMVNVAAGNGLVPAVITAGGFAGGAAALQPARTSVTVEK